jgi:hypothetical protein
MTVAPLPLAVPADELAKAADMLATLHSIAVAWGRPRSSDQMDKLFARLPAPLKIAETATLLKGFALANGHTP